MGYKVCPQKQQPYLSALTDLFRTTALEGLQEFSSSSSVSLTAAFGTLVFDGNAGAGLSKMLGEKSRVGSFDNETMVGIFSFKESSLFGFELVWEFFFFVFVVLALCRAMGLSRVWSMLVTGFEVMS